eukprot:TRINITY_DN23239_c0_g1_i1.p1 TRINITY_DN23239_c0_g1~~TRINITY_DN23239_c0_g1_i1.p1  ORF type:complete len:401 (+),score=127.72 TRINITY_DN23239_c0_g1_i1:61-1203(+)
MGDAQRRGREDLATSLSDAGDVNDIAKNDLEARSDPTKKVLTIGGVAVRAGYLSLLVLVVQNAALVLMTRWTRSHKTGPGYHSSVAVFMAEVLKMAMSMALLVPENKSVAYREKLYHAVFNFDTVKLAIPAGLFTLQNFLLFVSLSNLDAMTFQLLSQIKLLLAALFSVMMLDRYLTCVQWSSVMLLTVGIALASQGKGTEKATTTSQNNMLGVTSCIVSGISSAFASVYFEKILKGSSPSIAVRNIQLGIFSLVYSFFSICFIDGVPYISLEPMRGFGFSTWCVALLHAGGGILVAVVVKYSDNILKGFATGVAIIVSGLFAALFWGFAPTLNFIVGSLIVTFGTCVYNIPDPDHPTVRKLAHMMPGGYRYAQELKLPT